MNSAQVLFDPENYARAYPDVAQSGQAPRDHYERYGRILGRSSAPDGGGSASWMQMSPAELDRALSRRPLPTDGNLAHDDLVSIIMPSYNNAEWIARAIHSALSQQSVKVELIVVDDGSTDESVSIARRIAADWPNIRVISLLRNFGCYYARNVGVTEAQGAYITIIDSDDIMVSDRILKQLDALKAHPESCACLARTRRWSEDMSVPMGDVRYAENTLLWKRSLVDQIGYYDSVRFGGDTEFRMRIEAVFGKTSVLRIPDEVYFLRTLDTSLTTAAGSVAYINQNGMLQLSLSDDRKRYSENLKAWHEQATQAESSEGPRIEFPQLARPFDLGSPAQSASPSIGQRRVGAMASFPLRRASLEATLQSILPQLDLLILYLNDYDDVPDFARHPKIRAILSKDALGDLRDNGKFFDLPQDDCSYVFTFDDDLLYPPNYTARLIHQIELLGRSCIVGLHGVIFPYENFTLLGQRTVFHFMHEAPGKFVDLLGTGTTAWHSSLLKPSLQDFSTTGLCDLWFAALCARLNIPLYSVPRGHRWVDEFAKYEVSLWLEAAERPKGYFEVYNSIVAPVLGRGRVRRGVEAHLAWSFSADVLTAAQVNLEEICLPAYDGRPMPREIVHYPAAYGSRPALPDRPHFHLVLCGRDNLKAIDKTLRSVAEQHPGPFTCDFTLVDDGSTDGSFEKLAKALILPTARLLAVDEQTGTAYGRDLAIRQIRERETIILSLKFGDVLAPGALRALASHFTAHPEHDMVNCISDMDDKIVSRVLAFRRHLYDASPEVLQDELGRWLDDASADVLTRDLGRNCASDRMADFDTRVLNAPMLPVSSQSPIAHEPVTTAKNDTNPDIDLVWVK